ncbi:hypothetical protein O0L34_g1877 [Tuta absoluta]|nr:hypothetical protein O0L34_g1877 [Tuta absoluta]
MDDIRNFSEHELEQLTYRILQQIAKSMSLPSNVKKMYLIQLIYAKTHKTEVEVLEIVQRVRYERQLSSQHNNRRKGKKKMHLQAMEVSSSNACMSPPIDLTPTRGSLAYSPEMPRLGPVIKYHPRDPRCESPKNTSDRVLRSYNIRSYKRPNYSLINNSVLELVKAAERASSPKEKETRISIVSHEGRHPRLNVTARCVLKKIRPFMTNHSPRSYLKTDNVTSASIASSSSFTHAQSTSKALVPAKRARALSGITPLPPQPPLQYNYEFVKSVGFRRTDGKLSKINALVQKPAPKIICNIDLDAEDNTSYKNVQVTIQDIINSNIDAQTFTQPRSEYTLTESNMAYCHVPLTDVMPQR